MGEIKAWVESHPYIAGSGLLAIIVLFFVFRGSSSSAATSTSAVPVFSGGTSDAVQVAQLQAATSAAANQNAGILANNQLSAEIAAKQLDSQTAITLGAQTAQVQLENLHVTGDVQNNANQFAYQTVLSNNQTVLGVTNLNDATTLGVTQANDATALGIAQVNAGTTSSLLQTIINTLSGKGSATTTAQTPAPYSASNPNVNPSNTISQNSPSVISRNNLIPRLNVLR